MSWHKHLFFRRRFADLSDELRAHLEEKIDDLVAQGLPRGEAEHQARREFGNVTLTERDSRDVWRWLRLEDFLLDLRFALRMLRKSSGFTAVAILTLALGIGANTAIFSVVQGVLLSPLPFHEPDRLALMLLYNPSLKSATYLAYPDFLDWQRDSRSFQQIAAFTSRNYDLTYPGAPEHLEGREISSGFISTLGVNLALGREFSPEEDRHGAPPVVIISDVLWKTRFDANPAALGKTVTLEGTDYAIVGVLPPHFLFGTQPAPADLYTPIGQGDLVQRNNRTVHNIACIARLKPGVNFRQAQDDLNAVQESIGRLYPAEEHGLQTQLSSLKQDMIAEVSGTLLLLLGAVGAVLLIACANVANLLLARSFARTREFAIRSALGADRFRIIRQLITESLLLSMAGAGMGLAAAKWTLPAVLLAISPNLPRRGEITLDSSVLLFTLAVSVTVGILLGLLPGLKSSWITRQTSLNERSRGPSSASHRVQNILVAAQVALTLVLLVGAGLLFRTIRHLWQVDPGLATQNVITFKMGLSPSLTRTPPSTRATYQQLIQRIDQIHGVQSADLTTLLPLSGDDNELPFWTTTSPPASISLAPRVVTFSTGPDYLRVMGIPLLQGRFFTPQDTDKSARVVVLDTVMARTCFPQINPVGQTINFVNVGAYRVIGVVGHVQHWGLDNPAFRTQNQAYTAFYQIPDRWLPVMQSTVTVAVRTSLEPAAVMPSIKAATLSVGGDQPIYNVQTIHQIIRESMSTQRFPMILLGAFSALALVLASVGVYGVISYSVTQRLNEIGIRVALGAERRSIFRLIVGQCLRIALAGLAIGAVAAILLTRLLSNFSTLLYGVSPSDPLTFIAVPALLITVALAASWIPARRAMRVDPILALRHE